MTKLFAQVANNIGRWMGLPLAFVLNALLILVWALSGPVFGFSDTWQLVINTGTTVFTYLLLFIIQNTQNRNTAALHIKLDEILRAIPDASTDLALAHVEDADEKLLRLEKEKFRQRAQR